MQNYNRFSISPNIPAFFLQKFILKQHFHLIVRPISTIYQLHLLSATEIIATFASQPCAGMTAHTNQKQHYSHDQATPRPDAIQRHRRSNIPPDRPTPERIHSRPLASATMALRIHRIGRSARSHTDRSLRMGRLPLLAAGRRTALRHRHRSHGRRQARSAHHHRMDMLQAHRRTDRRNPRNALLHRRHRGAPQPAR